MRNKLTVGLVAFLLAACGKEVIKGIPGPAGQRGANGEGCSVQAVGASPTLPNGGALITCGSTSTIVANGSDGAPGAASVMEVIVPCPETATAHSETLLRAGNVVIASFSSNAQGDNTRLTVLVPGQGYVTTDNRGCSFSINANGELN